MIIYIEIARKAIYLTMYFKGETGVNQRNGKTKWEIEMVDKYFVGRLFYFILILNLPPYLWMEDDLII